MHAQLYDVEVEMITLSKEHVRHSSCISKRCHWSERKHPAYELGRKQATMVIPISISANMGRHTVPKTAHRRNMALSASASRRRSILGVGARWISCTTYQLRKRTSVRTRPEVSPTNIFSASTRHDKSRRRRKVRIFIHQYEAHHGPSEEARRQFPSALLLALKQSRPEPPPFGSGLLERGMTRNGARNEIDCSNR